MQQAVFRALRLKDRYAKGGDALVQRGALDKSIATLRIAIFEAEGAEDRLLHAEMLRELGEISRAVGNAGAARSAWREAVDSYQVIGASKEIAEVQAQLKQLPG